MLAVISD